MKKLFLSTLLLLNTLFGQKLLAQSCPIFEGFKAIQIQYVFNGTVTNASFPLLSSGDTSGVPGLLNNCLSVWNEATGQIDLFTEANGYITGIYGQESLVPYCQCILQGPYFRRVYNAMPGCNYHCPPFQQNSTPATDKNTSSSNWSASATWEGNAVPDMSTAAAVFITKPTSIDVDVAVSGSQWLVVGNTGNATINPGVNFTNNSIIQVRPNGQLQNNGTMKGNGKMEGSFINNANFSPGNSPGNFTISGNYTATASASHNIELASATLNDSIVVGGNAVLNGQLNISLYNGFVPIPGQAFTLLSANNVTGTFSNIVLPPGVSATVIYNTNSVVLIIDNIVLPLRLLSFSSNETSQHLVQLNWQTINEINTSHFIVQRSANGTTFNNIGRVEARNTSGNNDYSLTDASPVDGINFYRLQMVDIDGKTNYSSIIKTVFSGKSALQVFPNPAKNVITLSGLQNKGIIKIIAPDGKLVKQLSATANSMLIDISTLAKGFYILQYNDGGKMQQVKFIKE